MSYTAPQYVDTKEQAVLALASTIKGEAVTGGDGSVNRALDILADVLAEQDVQVPQTDAGAILALAQYASGMVKPEGTIAITENGEGIDVAQYATADVSVSGGGGAEFGSMIDYTIGTSAPEVNDPFVFIPLFSNVYVGDTKIIECGWQYANIYQAAAGLTIELTNLTSSTVAGYVCTYSVDEYDEPDSYTAVTAWDGTIDVTDNSGSYSAKFTLPELTGEHKQLFIVAQVAE